MRAARSPALPPAARTAAIEDADTARWTPSLTSSRVPGSSTTAIPTSWGPAVRALVVMTCSRCGCGVSPRARMRAANVWSLVSVRSVRPSHASARQSPTHARRHRGSPGPGARATTAAASPGTRSCVASSRSWAASSAVSGRPSRAATRTAWSATRRAANPASSESPTPSATATARRPHGVRWEATASAWCRRGPRWVACPTRTSASEEVGAGRDGAGRDGDGGGHGRALFAGGRRRCSGRLPTRVGGLPGRSLCAR